MLAPLISSSANPRQRDAITSTDGPLLIIAGPGSGKTFTLVERVVYLITEKGVTPEQLMVVTFTDKAAQELTTRIANRLVAIGVRFNLNEMYLGTFHSICLRWLQDHREFTRLKRNFTLMDQFDQQYFLYQHLRDYDAIPGVELLLGDPQKTSAWYRTEKLLRWVNTVSEEALEPEALIAAPDPAISTLGRCAALYRQQLDEANALDFSAIQHEALRLLRFYPAIRDAMRQRIAYLMVDEYQDTNTIQEFILMELAQGEAPNLCVVGDDDQGLYRFRGATIRNILQFKEKFAPGVCKQVFLETNYRSHPAIIDFYNGWMAGQDWEHDGQTFRYPKTIVPRDDAFPERPVVLKLAAKTADAWHAEVLDLLHGLRDAGTLTDWNQVAFLFRSVKHEQVRGLATFLEAQGIPVYSPRANQFFDREEIRLIIGALIFLFPQFPQVRMWKPDAHLDIWDYYDEQCFRPFAEHLRQPENADLLKWARRKARDHMALTQNADYAFAGLFYELLRFPLFSRYLDETLLQNGLLDSRPMRNLGLFSQMLNKFEYLHHVSVLTPDYLEKNLRDLFNQFLRFLHDGGINEYEDEAEYAPSGHVSFLTIHQAKGLEFPVVVVGSLGAVPRKQYSAVDVVLEGYLARPPYEPLEKTKFYDFRRLYYTAFSRAQNLLLLTALEVNGTGRTPSRYFTDYYTPLPSWRAGQVKLAAVPLAHIKDVKLKREYSFTSHLTVFENCAEQYRFFRELAFAPLRKNPILFGTLVHQTIEDIHKTVLRGEQQRVTADQIAAWFDTNYAYLTRRERVYLAPPIRQLALEHVLRYVRRNGNDWSHIREAEVDVSLVKDEYILAGKVDLIQGEGDTVEVVDFKSERKLDVNDPRDRERLNQYRRQLEVYAHIIEQRTGLTVSRTHLYYTSEEGGNPYISFDKNTRSVERTIAVFDEVVQRIEAKDFAIPERPAKACSACDLRHYCDAKNWEFRVPS
ncbi:ATP-dependent DNA helicase [Candidatus Chloroploca sp. Khr17]|uniref:ATP-dependent helicase n=1 Tax=Candidatus Chloroploca sp. Khr17 TaxID=2496869 RepID=UPI00101BC72B|nr:ATP-dependent DNA helicase [Candidatus Chloroploca sp. Khr17]